MPLSTTSGSVLYTDLAVDAVGTGYSSPIWSYTLVTRCPVLSVFFLFRARYSIVFSSPGLTDIASQYFDVSTGKLLHIVRCAVQSGRSFVRGIASLRSLQVSSAIALCTYYAMPGTDLAHAATCLRAHYAMSGTDLAYGASGTAGGEFVVHVQDLGGNTVGVSQYLPTPRNQIEETAFSVQSVPGMRFLVFDFGV
eukprot:3940745-Rhodomonas_salina.8